jgi:serine/threonine protein phosphatase PrpC
MTNLSAVQPFDSGCLSKVGGRDRNEDSFGALHLESASCWAVADGLGGHRGGDVASRTAVDAVLVSFRDRPDVSPEAVAEHFSRAQAAVVDEQRRSPALARMRSTLVVLVADGSRAVWGHVGDTRLYYLTGGCVVDRTKDHSVVQALVDVGEVRPDDQGRHEDRARLLRTLGQPEELRATIERPPRAVHPRDGFLLCTDGFWETLGETEIELDFAAASSAQSWLERLEARLRARSFDGDNYTAIGVVVGVNGR